MCKVNSLFKLIITSLLRNNCVPVRNKRELFLIFNLPFRVRAIPFIITESFFIFTADGKFENVKYVSIYVK